MRTLIAVLISVLLVAGSAIAGEIFGSILKGGKPVSAGMKVAVTSAGKTYSADTDKFGSYRLFVKEKGKCAITLFAKEGDSLATAELVSYEKSTRYDWILETQEGVTSLRRK